MWFRAVEWMLVGAVFGKRFLKNYLFFEFLKKKPMWIFWIYTGLNYCHAWNVYLLETYFLWWRQDTIPCKTWTHGWRGEDRWLERTLLYTHADCQSEEKWLEAPPPSPPYSKSPFSKTFTNTHHVVIWEVRWWCWYSRVFPYQFWNFFDMLGFLLLLPLFRVSEISERREFITTRRQRRWRVFMCQSRATNPPAVEEFSMRRICRKFILYLGWVYRWLEKNFVSTCGT